MSHVSNANSEKCVVIELAHHAAGVLETTISANTKNGRSLVSELAMAVSSKGD